MPYDRGSDPYADGGSAGIARQGSRVVAVTPDDNTDLTTYAKALYIGVAGDVEIIAVGDSDASPHIFKNHPVGYMLCQVRRVRAAGTTATNILGLLA